MSANSRFDYSQNVVVSSPNELQGLLSGCRSRRQPAVTLDSDLLQTHDWRTVTAAIKIDLSAMASVSVDDNRRLALVDSGARYSSLWFEAQRHGLTPEFEPVLGIDFTMSDWAHESLRMLSTTTSGLDGVLRNVKVIAPTKGFQTGFDTTPANGGGYDLTKLYMSSGATLGVPYEFAVPLRPLPEKMAEKTYAFAKLDDAIGAGIRMHKSGYAKLIRLRSAGFDELLFEGKIKRGSSENRLIVRLEGSQSFLETAEKTLDEIANGPESKTKEALSEITTPMLIDTASINQTASPIGIFSCDALAIGSIITDLSKLVGKAKETLYYCIADLNPNSCVIVPMISESGASELLPAIGSLLADMRIPLRGNRNWNSILGDSRAVPRIEIVRNIKRFLDPETILNPHVIGAW